MNNQIPIQVEVELNVSCLYSKSDIILQIQAFLEKYHAVLKNGEISLQNASSTLKENVNRITIDNLKTSRISLWQAELYFIIYKLLDHEPEKDYIDGEDESAAFNQWELPNKHLHGLWDSIIVDSELKAKLLSYCDSSIRFTEASIDSNIISWNRLCLLHGPPGTGNTYTDINLYDLLFDINHVSIYL